MNIFQQPVTHIIASKDGPSKGVILKDGREISSKVVLSNATSKVTFLDLLEKVLFGTNINLFCIIVVLSYPIILSTVFYIDRYMYRIFQSTLEEDFIKEVSSIDFTSPVTKINGMYYATE